MTSEEFKRKLTVILSADLKGYTHLMGEDEEGTIRTLNPLQRGDGRLHSEGGDRVSGYILSK